MTVLFSILTILVLSFSALIGYRAIRRQRARRRRLQEEELAARQQWRREMRESEFASLSAHSVPRSDITQIVETDGEDMITVTEIARVTMRPDTVWASITLSTREKDYRTCQTELDTRTRTLTDKIRTLGLPDLFVASSEFRIAPDYDYDRKMFNKGFNGSHEFTVKFSLTANSLETFYAALFATEDKAELELSFRLSNVTDAKNAAIAKAVELATETARAAAQSAGQQLGKLISLRPTVAVGTPRQHRFGSPEQLLMREAALRATDSGSAVPSIEAGELEVVASATMRFRFA
ncbi:MAG: SIMPL domain-containing protein [Leptospirales bacterium]|nr:SIMPL domain-containing protein [Leptospirales bacterium]